MIWIVSSNGTFVNTEDTSKLTNLWFELKEKEFKCSKNWFVDCNMYVWGIYGFMIESKNFASLYSGVPIMDTTGRTGLPGLCTLFKFYPKPTDNEKRYLCKTFEIIDSKYFYV